MKLKLTCSFCSCSSTQIFSAYGAEKPQRPVVCGCVDVCVCVYMCTPAYNMTIECTPHYIDRKIMFRKREGRTKESKAFWEDKERKEVQQDTTGKRWNLISLSDWLQTSASCFKKKKMFQMYLILLWHFSTTRLNENFIKKCMEECKRCAYNMILSWWIYWSRTKLCEPDSFYYDVTFYTNAVFIYNLYMMSSMCSLTKCA